MAERWERVPRQRLRLLAAICFAILIHALVFWGLMASPAWKKDTEVTILRVVLLSAVQGQATPEAMKLVPLERAKEVSMPSNQETTNTELPLERAEQRIKPDKLMFEQQQQQQQQQQSGAREHREQMTVCISPEEVTRRNADQMKSSDINDGRVPCIEG